MKIEQRVNVPDVYGQHKLISAAIEGAYNDGLGTIKIDIVEPVDSLQWDFTVTGEDGVRRPLTITAAEQLDYDNLLGTMRRKLRELLAYAYQDGAGLCLELGIEDKAITTKSDPL